MNDMRALLAPIRRLHALIRGKVVEACERAALEDLAEIERDEERFERVIAVGAPAQLTHSGCRPRKPLSLRHRS